MRAKRKSPQFKEIMQGLQDAIEYEKGDKSKGKSNIAEVK